MMSRAVRSSIGSGTAMCRRRSPSVMMPASAPVVVEDAGHPELLAAISVITSRIARVGRRPAAARRPCASARRRASGPCRACRPGAGSRNPLPGSPAAPARHRQRVAERQRRGGAGRRRQVQRTRFFVDVRIEHDVGGLAERRARDARSARSASRRSAGSPRGRAALRASRRCATARSPRLRPG